MKTVTCRLCKTIEQSSGKVYYLLCTKCYRHERNRVKHQNKRKNRPSNLHVSTWLDCLLLHSFKCRFCPKDVAILDHIVCMSHGGTNTLENIQPLCKTCDSRKSKIEGMISSARPSDNVGGGRLKEKHKHLFEPIAFALDII